MDVYENVRSVSAVPAEQLASVFWKPDISLHDCLVTAIQMKGNDLVFTFDDGYWLFPDNPEKPVCATGRAAVVFHLAFERFAEKPEVILYEREKTRVYRREMPFSVFMERVNNGDVFEFVNQYFNCSEVLFRGYFGPAQTFRNCACDLRMTLTGVDFCWNGLNRERRW